LRTVPRPMSLTNSRQHAISKLSASSALRCCRPVRSRRRQGAPYDEGLVQRSCVPRSRSVRRPDRRQQAPGPAAGGAEARVGDRRLRLILPGGVGAGTTYGEELAALAASSMSRTASSLPARSATGNCALYRGCDVFLSLSEHEGFACPGRGDAFDRR
jgi:hypothetical protein